MASQFKCNYRLLKFVPYKLPWGSMVLFLDYAPDFCGRFLSTKSPASSNKRATCFSPFPNALSEVLSKHHLDKKAHSSSGAMPITLWWEWPVEQNPVDQYSLWPHDAAGACCPRHSEEPTLKKRNKSAGTRCWR